MRSNSCYIVSCACVVGFLSGVVGVSVLVPLVVFGLPVLFVVAVHVVKTLSEVY